ncbi:hypothetical protein Tco_0840559 [Tanacetum coccineum]|uniref:Uncharacterized protein n=1 Tax=Tanacetum coccineum TaxID=301880 RepID=A0ABQ5AWK0_9ASTR
MGRDTIQLKGAISTIFGEYLLEFTSEYDIPENLHPEVPGLGETIVDFPEGKVGVYTRFFEFANYCVPLSQFLFDILGHYQIHLSQLSGIGAAKVSNLEINCRVHNIIPTLNLFRNTSTAVSDPEPLSYAKPQPHPVQDIAQSSKGAAAKIPTEDIATTEVNVQLSMGSPNSGKSTSSSVGGSPGGIYQPGWGVTNNCHMDSPEACQDMVDFIVPPGYFSELRHLHNMKFFSQYNTNLARQVAMGSQLRLRFEQEVRLLKKATAKIARRDQKIQAREEEIKKLDEEKDSKYQAPCQHQKRHPLILSGQL